MALLDFMKDRPQPQAAAKPMAATPGQQAATRDVAKSLSGADLAKVHEIGARLQKATVHVPGNSQGADGSSNAALLQKQNNQNKTQAAMSPTDRFAGQTSLQKRSGGWER